MQMNKYLATTLFSGLFLTAAILSPAMGQEQSLQPESSWSVTKVDKTAQGGNSYCTLSRKYQEGIVLSLGRNQTEEYSLAIDFQKPVFTKDKAVKINLQPGPGQLRAYDMMPTSDKAVVVRLGWDEGFFDVLNQSQQMKVKIADKSYAFAMPEIAKGQGDLTNCMEALQTAAKEGKGESKAAQTKDVLNAEPTKTSDAFDASKAGDAPIVVADAAIESAAQDDAAPPTQGGGFLSGLMDGFGGKTTAAKADNDAAPRKNFGKASNESDSDVKASDAVKTASAKAQQDLVKPPIAIKENVVEANPAELAKVAPAAAPIVEAKVAEKPVVVATAKKEEAPKAAEEKVAVAAPAVSAESQKLQKEMDAIFIQKQHLEEQLSNAKKELASKPAPRDLEVAETKMKELEIKNAQLEDSLRQSQTRIAETAINTETRSVKQIVDLQTKLEAAQKDNTALAKQLESYKLQQEDQRLNVVAGDWDLENATKRYNESQREVTRLAMQLEQQRMACNQEKAQIEGMLFDPAVTEKKQIERLSKLQGDLDAANLKLASADKLVQDQVTQQVAQKTQKTEQEKAALIKESTSLQNQVATIQKNLAERDLTLASLQNEVKTFSTLAPENKRLTLEVAELQKAVATKDASIVAEKTSLQTQMDTLKTALAEKDKQIVALNAQPKIDPAAANAEKTALQTQINALKTAMAEKDNQIVALNAQPKIDPAAANAEKAALQTQINVLKTAMAEKDNQIVALNAQPKVDPAAVNAEKAALQTQMNNLKLSLSQKDQEIAAMKAQPKTDPMAEQQAASLRTQNQAMQQNIEGLKVALASKDKQIADAQAAVNAATIAAATPKADPAVMKQLSDLQTTMATIQKDNTVLRDQNTALQQDANKARLQLADAQNNGAARADRVASAQLEAEELKRQMAMKDRQNATYQNQIAALQQESAQLKTRLAEQVRAQGQEASAASYTGIAPAAGYVSPAVAAPAPVVQSVALATPAVRPTVSARGGSGYSQSSIQSLLQKAGLSVSGLQKSPGGFVDADNYSWTDSSNVRGLASVRALSGADFDGMISQYISFQKGQCGGDFASMPSPTNGNAAKRMALYEIACVGASQSLSSSILFFEDQGRFIAISNQIQAADMDLAMDSRDRVANFVRGL